MTDPDSELHAPIVFVSSVTAPFSAAEPPQEMLAPVVSVTLWSAIRYPVMVLYVPSVADDPISQSTLSPLPSFSTDTVEPLAVVSVLPIWKTKVVSFSPAKFRTSAPVNWADDAKKKTPGVRVKPPRF